MLKILPAIFIIILIAGGLIWWRFSTKSILTSPQTETPKAPAEVPKTLPGATLEDRIKSIEDSILTIVNKINSATPPTQSDAAVDTRLKDVEAQVTEVKARVSSLERLSPAPAVSSAQKVPLYIPLGSGGQTTDSNWANLNSVQISLDPASYPGYTSMQLEVNMRLNQPGGQVSARLYNSSSSSATSSEISSTSTTSSVGTSGTFTLPGGSKNYILQAKSKDGSLVFIDNARIKVNF